jgi:hypothetical protein
LRPLAVSEILDGAFTTIRRHPKATLGVSAVFACVQQGLNLGVQAATGTLTSTSSTGFSPSGVHVSANGTGTDLVLSIVAAVVSVLLSLVVTAVLTGLLCLVVSDSVLGQPSSAGAAWRRMRPLFWRVLGASVLVSILQVVGLAFCLIPGIFLWGAWALVVPALVLERIPVVTAMRRSWRLVTPSFWRVFGLRLLGVLIASAVAAPFTVVLVGSSFNDLFHDVGSSTATPHLSTTTVVLAALVSVITTTLTAPFLAGMVTLLYVDRRIRAEALDVQLQQAAALPPPATSTSYG